MILFIGHLDEWFTILSGQGNEPHGEIHLILHYEKLIV